VKKHIKKKLRAFQRARYLRNPTGLTLPDFIYIGSGQSGSTWMFKNFQAHPDVFVCDKKESHYFSTQFDDWPFDYYCSLFEAGAGKVSGELTPAYMLLTRKRIQEIQQLLPDGRLVLTIRHPVDRAWSGARRTISNVFGPQNIAFEDVPDSEFYAYFDKEWAYKPERNDRGEYTPGMLQAHYLRAIDNWTSYFNQEQLLITFFDDILSSPETLMKQVCQHIGANTDIDWSAMPLATVVNKNPTHPLPDKFRAYLTELYTEEITALKNRFGEKTQHW